MAVSRRSRVSSVNALLHRCHYPSRGPAVGSSGQAGQPPGCPCGGARRDATCRAWRGPADRRRSSIARAASRPVRGPPVLRVPSSCIVPRYIVLRCEERNDMAARPGGAATHRRCIVLSDHERKTLREFERQFQVEDPEFTARSAPGRSACVAGTSTERGSRSWPRCSCGCCRPWSRWRRRRASTLVLPFPVELLRFLEHASLAATPDTAIPATTATMPPSGPPAATSTGPEPAAAAGAWENDAVGTGRAHPAAPKAATVAQGAAQR